MCIVKWSCPLWHECRADRTGCISALFFIRSFLGARELHITINLHSTRDKQTPRPPSTRLFCRKLPVSTSAGFCDLLIRSHLRRSVLFKSLDLLSLCVVCEYHWITDSSWNRKTMKQQSFPKSFIWTVLGLAWLMNLMNATCRLVLSVLNADVINDYIVINIIINFLRYLLQMPQFVSK